MKHIRDVMSGTVPCPYCGEIMVSFAIEVSLDMKKVERECEKIVRQYCPRLARHIMTCKAVDIVGRDMDDWLEKP